MLSHNTGYRQRIARKTIIFDGSAGAGEVGTAVTVFSVTGEVWVDMIAAFCTTSLTEASATATIETGLAATTTRFIAQTNSVDIDQGEFWTDASPGSNQPLQDQTTRNVLISTDIIITPLTQNTDGGELEFTVFWRPVSDDGSAVAA